METLPTFGRIEADDLVSRLAEQNRIAPAMIQPFADFSVFLTDLLRTCYQPGCRLLAAGHVEPAVEIAADRAEIPLIENIGPSPFQGDIAVVLDAVKSPRDIIFVSNPNRVTGANYSTADLQRLSDAVPDGALIVDECYHDFFLITALPLIDSPRDLVVLRSFMPPRGLRATDSGYAVARPGLIATLNETAPTGGWSAKFLRAVRQALATDYAPGPDVREVHDESLRLALGLNRLGVQCRLTATDFILLRVADPVRVGNELTRDRVPIENLDGYPAMKNYLRYRVQSRLSNDGLLEAFGRMDPEAFRMRTIDRRALTMRMKSFSAEPALTSEPASIGDVRHRIAVTADDIKGR